MASAMVSAVSPATPWCVPLSASASSAPSATSSPSTASSSLGGKGQNLQRLLALSVSVPEGFGVPAEVFATVCDGEVAQALRAALSPLRDVTDVDHEDGAVWQRVSAAATAVVMGAPLPAAFVDAVAAARAAIDGAVIVRSSAVFEDGDAASFAGQLDSFPDVGSSVDDVVSAIRRCWASAFSARVLHYRHAKGHDTADIATEANGVAVVVQRYVNARYSGVVFTRGPHAPDDVYGEFCVGAGEGLVSGRVTPGAFHGPRDPSSGLTVELLPDDDQHRLPALPALEAQLRDLRRCALEIEAAFGAPQDIEFCVDDDGVLWIVQARPITTGAPPASTPTTTTTTTSRRRLQRFTNANVNENFPEPLSPLLYSIVQKGYRAYFQALGEVMGLSDERMQAATPALSAIVSAHGARLYYNLSSLHGCLQVAPFGEWLTTSFNVFVGVDGGAAESSRFRQKASLLTEAAAAMRFVAHASIALATATTKLSRFEDDVDAFAAAAHPTLVPHLSDDELVALVRRFVWIRTERWSPAAMGDVSAMMGYGLVRSWLKRRHPSAAETLENDLLKGLADVVSGVPTQQLWELAQRKRRRDPNYQTHLAFFLETWGFRRSQELSLTAPTFQDDPAPVLALIDHFVRDLEADANSDANSDAKRDATSENDDDDDNDDDNDDDGGPAARTAQHARARQAATAALLDDTPIMLRPALRGLLAFTRNGIGLRERARLKQALLYTRLGPVVRELGARLQRQGTIDDAMDIFMLSVDELIDQLSGSAMFGAFVKETVALRKAQHARLVQLQPAESFALPQGHYLRPDAPPATSTTALHGDDDDRDDRGDRVLTGGAAAAGTATAAAAVLGSVAEAARMKRGDVLVTKQTDPGWGPVLFLASALVIERGGMLSHGAIIAREFGVPCVVGVKDASARIKHGSTVTVDGGAGTVTLLEASLPPAPAAEPRA